MSIQHTKASQPTITASKHRLWFLVTLTFVLVSVSLIVIFISLSQRNTTSFTEPELVSPIDTTDWSTFTNTTYGYSFKYSPDWPPKDSGFGSYDGREKEAVGVYSRGFDIVSIAGIDLVQGLVPEQPFYTEDYYGNHRTLKEFVAFAQRTKHLTSNNVYHDHGRLERYRLASGHEAWGFVVTEDMVGSYYGMSFGRPITRPTMLMWTEAGSGFAIHYEIDNPYDQAVMSTLRIID